VPPPPPPRPCASPPPQPERLVMRKDEAVGNKKKNASLFTCDLIIFCSVSFYIKNCLLISRQQNSACEVNK
jgi:hypothetical protein